MYVNAPLASDTRETKNGRGHDRTQALKAIIGDRSVVYALRLPSGIIKIGCSAQLWNRRRCIDPGAEIIGFTFGDFADEKALHSTLVDHLDHGREYYRPTAAVLAVVNEMRDEWNLPHVAA